MSFRTLTQRLMVWGTLAVDLDPSQQCAGIFERLGHSARELADALSWQELTQGGDVGGHQLDPITFLLTQLAAHYAPFGEEQRVTSMTELMSFHRLPNERTDALVARYWTLCWRAAQRGGGMLLNWEGYSWLLLRACGITHNSYCNSYSRTKGDSQTHNRSLRTCSLLSAGGQSGPKPETITKQFSD